MSHSPGLRGPAGPGLKKRELNKIANPRLTELGSYNEYPKKPTDSPGSSLDRKLLKHRDDHMDTMTDDTFDGYSTNEFDDITSETDAEAVKFHPTKFNQIDNEINFMQKLPSMDNIYANEQTPSVDRIKSMSSFLQQEDNPPTPPPPLDALTSPDMTPTKKPRPVPKPRSTRNSNVSNSMEEYPINRNKPIAAPLHLSRENLNFAHKKPDWLADKLRETSASEASDDESINNSSFDSGRNNHGYIGSHENLSNLPYNKQLNIQLPQNDLSKPTSSNPPSLASDNLQNMDYMKDSYSSIDYGSHHHSKENLPSPGIYPGGSRENLVTPINRSRENLNDHRYPYDRGDAPTPTNKFNRSQENISDPRYKYGGSRENLSTPRGPYPYDKHPQRDPLNRSRENISGYGSRENLASYPNQGPPSYYGSKEQLQEFRGSQENLDGRRPPPYHRSQENLDGRRPPPYHRSQENVNNGVLQLQDDKRQHHSIETEI